MSSNGVRVLDVVRFGAQENGVASGRTPDGASGWRRLESFTPGKANAPRRVEDVVLNEIMYHPISDDDADEFVEVHNRSSQPVDLAGWRLEQGSRTRSRRVLRFRAVGMWLWVGMWNVSGPTTLH